MTLPVADPLFTVKRILLQQHSLATQQTFQLLRDGVRAEPYIPVFFLDIRGPFHNEQSVKG